MHMSLVSVWVTRPEETLETGPLFVGYNMNVKVEDTLTYAVIWCHRRRRPSTPVVLRSDVTKHAGHASLTFGPHVVRIRGSRKTLNRMHSYSKRYIIR